MSQNKRPREIPDRFTDRKHVIPAFWAVATSLLVGILLLIAQKFGSSPQEVVVTNPVDIVDLDSIAYGSNNYRINGPNEVMVPAFRMPPGVRGATVRQLHAFATALCPPNQVQAGDLITASFELFDPGTVSMATPVFLRLLEPAGPANTLVKFEQQYRIREGVNNLVLSSSFVRGDYILSFGFYMKDDLNVEFPEFYRQECGITIQ